MRHFVGGGDLTSTGLSLSCLSFLVGRYPLRVFRVLFFQRPHGGGKVGGKWVQRLSREKEDGMHILLTGAHGQLGHAIQHAFHKHEIVAYGRQQLDITQLDTVREAVSAHTPSLVVNVAAYNAVDQAESDSDAAYRANALGPRNLALVTATHNVPILHVSTDYVFDGLKQRPYHEFDAPNPQSVYGASKLAGEEAVRTLNSQHYIVRTAWLYHTYGKNFIKTMCEYGYKEEVQVINDQFGSPTYAPHLATVLAQLIETQAFGTYHLAGQGGTSRFDLVRTLYQLLDVQSLVKPITSAHMPRPAACPPYAILTSLQEPLFQLPPWQESLAQFVQSLSEVSS